MVSRASGQGRQGIVGDVEGGADGVESFAGHLERVAESTEEVLGEQPGHQGDTNAPDQSDARRGGQSTGPGPGARVSTGPTRVM